MMTVIWKLSPTQEKAPLRALLLALEWVTKDEQAPTECTAEVDQAVEVQLETAVSL